MGLHGVTITELSEDNLCSFQSTAPKTSMVGVFVCKLCAMLVIFLFAATRFSGVWPRFMRASCPMSCLQLAVFLASGGARAGEQFVAQSQAPVVRRAAQRPAPAVLVSGLAWRAGFVAFPAFLCLRVGATAAQTAALLRAGF